VAVEVDGSRRVTFIHSVCVWHLYLETIMHGQLLHLSYQKVAEEVLWQKSVGNKVVVLVKSIVSKLFWLKYYFVCFGIVQMLGYVIHKVLVLKH